MLHGTAMGSAEAALTRLCDPAAEVSAHYLVGEDGRVWALVSEERRAWHAGAGSWGGRADINSRSIGIEVANDARSPFTARSMDALEALLAGVLDRHRIPPEGVIAHSDMAPGRKSDPGGRFDWRRLALAGLSVWPGVEVRPAADWASPAAPAVSRGLAIEPWKEARRAVGENPGSSRRAPRAQADPGSAPGLAGASSTGSLAETVGDPVSGTGRRIENGPGDTLPEFQTSLRRFGYDGDRPEVMLAAFRLRFRPGVEGPADAVDVALAADLARRFPVDRGEAST